MNYAVLLLVLFASKKFPGHNSTLSLFFVMIVVYNKTFKLANLKNTLKGETVFSISTGVKG